MEKEKKIVYSQECCSAKFFVIKFIININGIMEWILYVRQVQKSVLDGDQILFNLKTFFYVLSNLAATNKTTTTANYIAIPSINDNEDTKKNNDTIHSRCQSCFYRKNVYICEVKDFVDALIKISNI